MFLPLLKVAGGGAIVIVSSINGVRTFTSPGAIAYSATKAAQVAMAQQLALELGRHSIRITVLCPGAIATEISASTHIKHREDVEVPSCGRKVAFLSRKASQAKLPMQLTLSIFC